MHRSEDFGPTQIRKHVELSTGGDFRSVPCPNSRGHCGCGRNLLPLMWQKVGAGKILGDERLHRARVPLLSAVHATQQ